MNISVALCTYNGAAYLEEQLASLLHQTRPPDELVVGDDLSRDDTAVLVERFARDAPFPVRLSVNSTNLGSTANFSGAIARCRGHVIALADQDDFWLPQKLAELERALAQDQQAGFVFSDAVIVDEKLQPLGYRLWDAVEFGKWRRDMFRRGQHFELLLKQYVVTGATMAFRAEYRDLLLPIPPCWVHDAWIALLISAVANGTFIEQPLIRYRQHAAQQIGEKKRGLYEQFLVAREVNRESYLREEQRYLVALERLRSAPDIDVAPEKTRMVEEKIAHFRARREMRDPGSWRFPRVLGELVSGRYRRFSRGWKSLAQDLFL